MIKYYGLFNEDNKIIGVSNFPVTSDNTTCKEITKEVFDEEHQKTQKLI